MRPGTIFPSRLAVGGEAARSNATESIAPRRPARQHFGARIDVVLRDHFGVSERDGSCVRLRPEHEGHVWAYDVIQAQTYDGRVFRMLAVIDEHTRECSAIDVARKLESDDALERLAWLFVTRGVPNHIRSDNDPEFTARVVCDWRERVGVKTLFFEPGSPWENGPCECFNGKLRDELLARELFLHAEGRQGAHRTLARALQHDQAAPLAGVPTTGPRSDHDRC